MKKSRLTLGNFINNKSFQRAQGKIVMSYPHCYSLAATTSLMVNFSSLHDEGRDDRHLLPLARDTLVNTLK